MGLVGEVVDLGALVCDVGRQGLLLADAVNRVSGSGFKDVHEKTVIRNPKP